MSALLITDVIFSHSINTPIHMNHLNSSFSKGYLSLFSTRLCIMCLLLICQRRKDLNQRVNQAPDVKQNLFLMHWYEQNGSDPKSTVSQWEWIDITGFIVKLQLRYINLHFPFKRLLSSHYALNKKDLIFLWAKE